MPPRTSTRRPRRRKESLAVRRERARVVADTLAELHPDAHCALRYESPFHLLVAVVLSAQTTDAKVNEVTPALFARYPTAPDLAAATQEDVEAIVRPLGFFRSKARALRELAQSLVTDHDGVVPGAMDELTALRGVGRKTANVVLGECFETPGITVDTHVRRLSQRMGLTDETDPDRIEQDLMALLPPEAWTLFSHRMIWHGRRVCSARKPNCPECALSGVCPTGRANLAG